ncbi:Aste57867_12767 [Aphanomyces stellatus]|uniref:Aste57867_12767 protein n=1 Tax=Aphanomyces stellatus TaxID=120398 RepID=A0A485KXU5_9STRA|nr:hypothetical protein As57867_012719 [Aphanomyces stellatus]VFT89616.1 Aste57867_12767 [Aphanomyces stellatus]
MSNNLFGAVASQLCHFNGCLNPVMRHGSRKCHFHRKRGICAILTCRNQVNKRGVCLAHGARCDPCSVSGCSMSVRTRGLCHSHSKAKSAPAIIASVEDVAKPMPITLFEELDRHFTAMLSEQYIQDVPMSLTYWPDGVDVVKCDMCTPLIVL